MRKGFLLAASIFLVLFVAVVSSISFLRSDMELRDVDLRTDALSAFYAAETGLENTIFELRKDMNWRVGFNNEVLQWYQGETSEITGYYTVAVVDGEDVGRWDTVWVRSQGTDSRRNVTRTIFARVAVDSPAGFFTFSLGNLIIGSPADISGDVLARDVIFEVNKGLPDSAINIRGDSGLPALYNGDVLYIRNIAGEKDPAVNVEGDIQLIPPITFASVDLGRYRDILDTDADGKPDAPGYHKGDVTYSGEINWANLGTNNGLVFAEGDINISGNVTQSVLIVAAGNINITDNITCEGGSQIGLFAHEDVLISDTAPAVVDVEAFIFADGGVFKAQGEKASKDTLNFTGAITVRGRETERTGIDLNVYPFRNYKYNTGLVTNPTIPFMSFIANIIDWEEVPATALFPPV